MFQNFVFGPLFQLLAKLPSILFAEDLVENLGELCSSWDISSMEDSDVEPLLISESSDIDSSSLSLSDSSEDELYFLFLDPLFFFLEESCIALILLAIFIFCLVIVMTLTISSLIKCLRF